MSDAARSPDQSLSRFIRAVDALRVEISGLREDISNLESLGESVESLRDDIQTLSTDTQELNKTIAQVEFLATNVIDKYQLLGGAVKALLRGGR